MSKVRVRKAINPRAILGGIASLGPNAPKAASGALEEALRAPQTRTGQVLGGIAGALGGLTGLAQAGENQQSLFDAASGAATRAGGGYLAAGRAGDRAGKKIGVMQANRAQDAWNQSAHPSLPVSATPEEHQNAFRFENAMANAPQHTEQRAIQTMREMDRQRNQQSGVNAPHSPSVSGFANTIGYSLPTFQLGQIGVPNVEGKFMNPKTKQYTPDIFDPQYGQSKTYQNMFKPGGALYTPPTTTPLPVPPPTTTDNDMESMAEDSSASVDPNANADAMIDAYEQSGPEATVGHSLTDSPVGPTQDYDAMIDAYEKKNASEPMDIAFRLLKSVMR